MNNEITETKDALIRAAASYFALPPDQVMQGSDMAVDSGTVMMVFHVALRPSDVEGITRRMRAMVEPEQAQEGQPEAAGEANEHKQWRAEYDGMDRRSKSVFGSFMRYADWRAAGGVLDSEVQATEIPAHVWMRPEEATDYQRLMAMGTDQEGRIAVSVDDLTEEQRDSMARTVAWHRDPDAPPPAPVEELAAEDKVRADELRARYVQRTVAATDRLTGADGKPTSNTDDFGGVPG